MININFNEKNVFTYDSENISIGIFQEGETLNFRHIGNIKFSSMGQAEHFSEMIEFMIEKKREEQ